MGIMDYNKTTVLEDKDANCLYIDGVLVYSGRSLKTQGFKLSED